MTAGLQAIGSRKTPNPTFGADHESIKAIERVQAGFHRLLQRAPVIQFCGDEPGRNFRVVVRLERKPFFDELAAHGVVIG